MRLTPFGEGGNGHNSSNMDQGPSLGGNLDTHGLTPLQGGVAVGTSLGEWIKGWA